MLRRNKSRHIVRLYYALGFRRLNKIYITRWQYTVSSRCDEYFCQICQFWMSLVNYAPEPYYYQYHMGKFSRRMGKTTMCGLRNPNYIYQSSAQHAHIFMSIYINIYTRARLWSESRQWFRVFLVCVCVKTRMCQDTVDMRDNRIHFQHIYVSKIYLYTEL